MKQIMLMAFIIGLFTMSATTTLTCFCVTPDVPEAFDRASAVFVGEVAEIIEPRTSDEKAPLPGRFFTIKFKVEKSWKGVPSASREISVLSAQGRYGCFAYPPVSKGERYLVYADPAQGDGGKGWSIITTCNRTSPIRFSLQDRRDIDPHEDMKKLDGMVSPSFEFNFRPSLRMRQGELNRYDPRSMHSCGTCAVRLLE